MSDDVVAGLLPAWLPRQRWYAGDQEPVSVTTLQHRELSGGIDWRLVDADGATYQVVLGSAPTGEPPDYLHGHEQAVAGVADDRVWFDAMLDQENALALLRLVTDGEEDAKRVRPMGAEQSNTSVVYDERLVLKLFRRLHPGPNPDVEVTLGLSRAGFDHVARPQAVWQDGDFDLAIVQDFLAGAVEGWALALTSLRDLYGGDLADPAAVGGDFAGEAERLGRITAQMHVGLADAFGTHEPDVEGWQRLMQAQLERIGAGELWREGAQRVFERYGSIRGGRAIRVHGDYHLGQVLRTDTGWFVLDFEGEPARPLDERRTVSSPLKDVAGMLRSFHYAATVALREREEDEHEELGPRAEAWEWRNREAFLRGYLATSGVRGLLPDGEDEILQSLAAWELDKAVYEVGYERAYRPDWVAIPRAAVDRLVAT